MKENLFPVTNAHVFTYRLAEHPSTKIICWLCTNTQLNLDVVPTLAAPEVIILCLCCLLVSIHPQAERTLVLHSYSRKTGAVNYSSCCKEQLVQLPVGYHKWAVYKHHLGEAGSLQGLGIACGNVCCCHLLSWWILHLCFWEFLNY